MGFENACFISYRHGLEPGTQKFYEAFRKQLARQVDFYLPGMPVYLDTERLNGGDFYNTDLAHALCSSVCMVSLYIPTYFDLQNTYTAREYRAMVDLEQRRLCLIPPEDWTGLIIPIILRGAPPVEISGERQYYSLNLLEPDDWLKRKSLRTLKQVAEDIYKRYNAFQHAAADPCGPCVGFQLPSEDAIRDWLTGVTAPPRKLPNR
jgi:hypothetical protein